MENPYCSCERTRVLQWDSETCPVEGALNFNADCPNHEKECILEYLGVDMAAAAARPLHQVYRFFVTENWGAASMCLYEVLFFGPDNCLYDMRDNAALLKTNQTQECWYTNECNTNIAGYGPANMFDDSLTPVPAASVFCTPGHWSLNIPAAASTADGRGQHPFPPHVPPSSPQGNARTVPRRIGLTTPHRRACRSWGLGGCRLRASG